jgi:hypothetical protein
MTSTKYIGMDVHKESISIAVRNAVGKVVMECVIETKAITILEFIHGLRGELQVTFEEGTWATWLYDLLKPHVTKLVVSDPRKNSRQGNKNDRIDARELSDRLYMNKLSSVYHGEAGVRTLKELARSYLTISKDLARVMTRVKALYRSWGIPCAGKQVYAPRHRGEWLAKITEVGVHRRAEFYYQQLDALRSLRHQLRRILLVNRRDENEVFLHSSLNPPWRTLRPVAESFGGPRGGLVGMAGGAGIGDFVFVGHGGVDEEESVSTNLGVGDSGLNPGHMAGDALTAGRIRFVVRMLFQGGGTRAVERQGAVAIKA